VGASRRPYPMSACGCVCPRIPASDYRKRVTGAVSRLPIGAREALRPAVWETTETFEHWRGARF
jgi:hypothetical protein